MGHRWCQYTRPHCSPFELEHGPHTYFSSLYNLLTVKGSEGELQIPFYKPEVISLRGLKDWQLDVTGLTFSRSPPFQLMGYCRALYTINKRRLVRLIAMEHAAPLHSGHFCVRGQCGSYNVWEPKLNSRRAGSSTFSLFSFVSFVVP